MAASASPANHELCLGPLREIAPASFDMPVFACDTHAHVISDGLRHPYVENRSYTPPPASEERYLEMLRGCGCERGVLVQVSVHGTDNRYMLEVLRGHPATLRGIAVVDDTVSDRELEHMHACGVRGIRFNVLFGGGVGFDSIETLAERIAPLGWHVQLLMDVRHLPELAPRLARLPVTCVFDHMGHMPVSHGMDHPGFQAIWDGMGNWTRTENAHSMRPSWAGR